MADTGYFLRFLTGFSMMVLGGLPIFTPSNIGITDSEYIASIVSGLIPSLVIRWRKVFTGTPNLTDNSESVIPFTFSIYMEIKNKSINVMKKVHNLLYSHKAESEKIFAFFENIFKNLLT